MTGRQALLALLRQEGVDTLFGNPGTTELPLMDEMSSDRSIRYVLGLHEGSVLAMADGYAQAGQRLGVVNLHAAPGLGNALGMLYDAQRAGSPVLVTAGQHDQSFTLTEPVLWADLPVIARPFVKWSGEVRRFEDLPRAVHRAAKVALTPPTGPVFLSIPGDVLMAEGELDLGDATRIGPGMRGDDEAIDRAVALLAQAERPLLIAGDAVAQANALTEMAEFAELLGAPVYLEGAANAVTFPASHPLFMGTMGRLVPGLRRLLDRHDVLFSVGGDLFSLSLPSDVELVPPGLRTIHLDNDPWEIGKNAPVEIAIQGSVQATLPEIARRLRKHLGEAGLVRTSARRVTVAAAAAQSREAMREAARKERDLVPIRAPALMEALSRLLPDEVTIVEEALSSRGQIREFMRNDRPHSFFSMRGGGIGWGLPAAVGVKLAQPDRPVLALIGDGSTMYSCQALWTAEHESLGGLVFLVLNNGGYRILKQRTRDLRGFSAQTGHYLAMDLESPAIDYQALARTYGMEGQRVRSVAELETILPRMLRAARPVLIEAMMDQAF